VLARELGLLRLAVDRGDGPETRALLGQLIPEATLALESKPVAAELQLPPEARAGADVRARRRREGAAEQEQQPHLAVGASNS